MDSWADIDTAPKDGRQILGKFASGCVCPGRWEPELEAWQFDLDAFPPGYTDWNAKLIGWRPLPDDTGAAPG